MNEYRIFIISVITTAVLVFSLIGYNLYTSSENRKAYYACLKMNDDLLRANPNKIGTHYCRL